MKSATSHIVLCAAAFFLWLPLASHAEISGLSHLPPTTPLTHAIRLERFDEARAHITQEWVNSPDRGQYHPLTYAAYTANNALMKSLLEAGADPNRIEANGKTALYVTANMANVEGLELLKNHGATTPTQDALSPAVAAIHSSCLESFKALIRLFPDTDLNRGWENRSKGGWLLVDSPGDPVAYAAYHGYDEMARFLLEKGARIVGIDALGKNALHHAAINSQCSAELVEMLVEHGCPPYGSSFGRQQWRPYIDLGPRTPLDYAALAGRLDKIRAMIPALDAAKDREAIHNAAHIAAAYRHEDIMRFLFNLLQEPIPSYPAFVRDTGNETTAQEPLHVAPSMSHSEVERIMPRPTIRKGEMPQEGTIAIIPHVKLQNPAAILTANLSARNGIRMVERDQIDAIVAERGLQGFANADSPQLHSTLDLIPARHIIFMTHHEYEDKAFARISVIHANSGIITATYAMAANIIADPEALGQVGDSIAHTIRNDPEVGTGISIAVLTPGSLQSDTASLARNLNTLLPHMAGNTPGFTNLSRDQLEYLRKENAIGVGDSFWAAAWVIDGGITPIENHRTELSLRAIHAVQGTEVIVKRTLDIRQIEHGFRECWNELIGKLSQNAKGGEAVAVQSESLEKEAELLQRHAKWLFEAGDYRGAAQLMQACLSLAKPDHERLNLALMSHLKITYQMFGKRYKVQTNQMSWSGVSRPYLVIYGEMASYAENYQIHPRATSHAMRLEMLDAADHYFRLAEIAELTIHSRPKHQRVYGWTPQMEYDRDIESTLTPFVSKALYELFHVAAVIDHSMVLAPENHQGLQQDLHAAIARITNSYLDYIEAQQKQNKREHTRMNMNTLQYLLYRDADFYARNFSDMHDRMLAMLEKTARSHGAATPLQLQRLFELAAAKSLSTREVGLARASESWDRLRCGLQDQAIKRNVIMNAAGPLYLASTRQERLDWLRFICNQPFSHGESSGARSIIDQLSIGNLVAMDERLQQNVGSSTMESALLDSADALRDTGEYLRMAALYRAIRDLKTMSESGLAGLLQRRPEIAAEVASHRPSAEWSHVAWSSIRDALVESRNLNPETLRLLDQLSGKSDEGKENEVILDLSSSDVVVLPSQPGREHRTMHSISERATIAGDELWMPCFSMRKHLSFFSGDADNDNVIQVVSLKDRSVATIVMPRRTRTHDYYGNTLGVSRSRMSQGRIEVTKDYAYHTPDGAHLFYIRRDNHEVGEIELPPGFSNIELRVVAAHPKRNFLLVSARNRSHKDQLRQVLLIKDKEVSRILVSNRRNPGESPLDNPELSIEMMEFHENAAWIGDVRKRVAHSYDLESGKWGDLPHHRVNGMINRTNLQRNFNYVESLPEQLFVRMIASHRGFNHGTWHMHTSYNRGTLSLSSNDLFSEHMIGHVRVKIPPVEHPAFEETWFPTALLDGQDPTGSGLLWPDNHLRDNYKGWWVSPNEAIRQGHFNVVVIGQWKSHFLLGVMGEFRDQKSQQIHWLTEEYGMQAIWLVPESDFNAARQPLRERHSKLIDFRSAWKPQQWKNAADLEFRNQKQDFWIAEQRPVQMHGGDSVFVIRPNHKNEARHLVMQIARSHRGRKIHFIIEVGDDENPTVLFDSMNHEISTSAEYRSSENFHIPLPKGTPEIRLINHSPRDHPLRINKILLMP